MGGSKQRTLSLFAETLLFTNMPLNVEVGHNQLFRIRVDSAPAGGRALRDAASNFSIEVLLSVDVSPDAGGSGLLLKIRRYPDDIEK